MDSASRQQVFSVAEVNRMARRLLEQDLPAMWVAGELSNLARPASGHIYFSLKDEQAQLRCALFRNRNRGLNFTPANGQQVIVRGRLSIYEARGDYQLIAEHMEPAGEGLLRQRLEALKRKLAAEGLFDSASKRPLPLLPRRVGVVTSPTGAALRDVLHILRRRFPAVPVVIYPTAVQGAQARPEIVRALELAGQRGECDVLIVARGGGSLEDLWAFNEEEVVRAVAASPLPVVSGVGHETDFTLTDLAADVRAPTPSGAAELVVPDAREWERRRRHLEAQLERTMQRQLLQLAQHQDQLLARLARTHPGQVLARHTERLDQMRARLAAAVNRQLALAGLRLGHLRSRLAPASPVNRLRLQQQLLLHSRLRLAGAMRAQLESPARRLALAASGLQLVSPLKTLERGYAIVQDASGRVVKDSAELKPGDRVTGSVAKGSFAATFANTSD
ncbi:MAG: exodeoxyribonuclease VII large subunit [Chromatiales bacterium]|nr:exodeoxyribonuclease VII large subunit [Chromatiales bacterium]